MSELVGPQKRRHLLSMLDEGMVMLHIDPRAEGVSVPPQYEHDPVLRLNIAHGFNLPALEIDDAGVYAVLSFNRANFPCNMPWPAIFAMTAPDRGHEGYVWPEHVPQEMAPFFHQAGVASGPVAISLAATQSAAPAPRPVPARSAQEREQVERPALADRSDDAPPTPPLFVVHEGGRGEDDPPPPPEQRKRPTLTVVKNGS